jgi:hypothetical protein
MEGVPEGTVAGFYAAVVLYSEHWHLIARAAGEALPFPGAPSEWTADQQRLWAIHQDYRNIASAVATWDGKLPESEVLEEPDELNSWFEDWVAERKQASRREPGEPQEHSWEFR